VEFCESNFAFCEACESQVRYDDAVPKLYVGARLRHLRESHRMSQQRLATVLGISPSYLNQLERGVRPLTVPVLLRITEAFEIDADFFTPTDSARLTADVREALLDEVGRGQVTVGDITELVNNLPAIARALVVLHRRHRAAVEHAAALVAGQDSDDRVPLAPMVHELVRDFFYVRSNYIGELDEAAEELATSLRLRPGEVTAPLTRALRERHGIEVRVLAAEEADEQHRYDPSARMLWFAPYLRSGQQAFRMASQLAYLEHDELLDRLVADGGLTAPQVRTLGRIGLAHYYAAALIMPYAEFLGAAEALRYDVERLVGQYGVGFETICHRLSTLQRPGARGVPFSFVRVDRAGNMSKRQSATGFHFSRVGGTCPLWNVYEAFESPGKVLVQVASMPDGREYLWIARTVTRGRGGYGQPGRTFAIGLGCDLRHARRLVYSTGLDLDDTRNATPIGMGCKVCDRPACAQRAFPPINGRLRIDERSSSFIPYPVEGP